jgi:hypothetical protein
MLSCRICKRITIDSSNFICATCNWNFHCAQNSEEEKWAQNQWTKIEELENKLEKSRRDYQKLKEEKEKINKKFESIYQEFLVKSEERERLLLSLLQPISSIPSKLDELIDAVKIPLHSLSVEDTPQDQLVQEKTIERIDKKEEEINPQNIPTKLTVQKPPEVDNKSGIVRQSLVINSEERELAKLYNEKHKKFVEYVIKVSLTQDSIEKDRLGKTIKLFFQKNQKGTYWILITDKQKYFLFPEYDFKLNEFNYHSLETSFTCYGDWQHETSELRILKPAIVKPIGQGGEKWEFVDKGIIEFTSI